MKTKEKTGLKYTNGKPICEGDVAIFWHEQEASKELAPFERTVLWDKDSAAYITTDNEGYGYENYLAESVNDVNCAKITKKK